MDLKMEVYSPGLELLGFLEIYTSVLWEEYAFKAGTFSVESIITDESKSLLVPDNIIWIEGDTAGIIEHIEQSAGEDGPHITVKGRLLAGILDRRILWGRYVMNDEAPALMQYLVEDNAINPTKGDAEARKIPGLALDGTPPTTGVTIRKQKTGGSLLETLEEIGEANNVAFGVKFDAQTPQMLFWTRPGVDRSVNQTAVDPVFYSTELDDVLSSEYSYDSSDYRNVSLVAGEGEGAERVFAAVSKGPSYLPSGYTKLEYIECSGEQYIDTGFAPNQDTRIVVNVQLSGALASSEYAFGGRNGYMDSMVFFVFPTDGKSFTSYYGSVYASGNVEATARNIIDSNKNQIIINGNTVLTHSAQSFQSNYNLYLFAVNNGGSILRYAKKTRMYSCQIYDDGLMIRNFVPCMASDESVGLYDLLGETFYPNSGSGVFTAGPETEQAKNIGLSRREIFVDARDLQSIDGETTLTEDEYMEVLETRGWEKLAENQLVQSFDATVRALNPTYQYGVDFFLGDTITVTDERLGVTVDAVVYGISRSVGKEGESLSLMLGYSQPTVYDILKRKAGK